MITAEEARKLTATPSEHIENQIIRAAKRAERILYLTEMTEELVSELKNAGFEVNELPDFAGMKEVIIKW